MKKITIALITFSVLAIPAGHAFAAATNVGGFQFQPIVSIPLPTGSATQSVSANTSLSCYINAAFKLAITVSVVLAVIMIIIDGFKYMTSEAVGNKKDALGGIRSALFGLILLLASWLVLNIINPQITSLSVVNFDGNGQVSCGFTADSAASTPVQTTATTHVPNPLDNPPQSTFGQNSSLTSSSGNTGTNATSNFCFAAQTGGSVCFDNAQTCNDARTAAGVSAGGQCLENTRNTSPMCVWFNSHQICDDGSQAPATQTSSQGTTGKVCVTFNGKLICDDGTAPK